MAGIVCVPLDGFPPASVADLAETLSTTFQQPVRLATGFDTQASAFDPTRSQVNSTAVLVHLQASFSEPEDRVLGLTTADLFIPVFTFVFGEAQLSGPAAVVSGFRLRNEFYGLASDPDLYNQRLLKESIHELGHTFGLRHCRSVGCVMGRATYVENIDLKTTDFCPACHAFCGIKTSCPAGGPAYCGTVGPAVGGTGRRAM